jgi:hypothetical protein
LDISDKLLYKFKRPDPPQFLDQSKNLDTLSNLDLTPIPVNNNFSPLSNEGVWSNLKSALSPDTEVMASTFIRPDPDRPYAIASVVQIDTKLLGIGSVAGTKEPGGSLQNPGTGLVPKNVLNSGKLVAIMNGGFLYSDGKYGMVVGNKTYAPLENNTGTLAAYSDGTVKIFNYTGNNIGKNVVFARQNGPLIIDNGEITITSSNFQQFRGRVLHGGDFTWRSGIGINKAGNIFYVAGNNLSPFALADALKMVGAVNAIQLDINPSQIYFFVFNKTSSGAYDSIPLNKALEFFTHRIKYFENSKRDFFYLYKK